MQINWSIEQAAIKKHPTATLTSNDEYFISSQFGGQREHISGKTSVMSVVRYIIC